MPSLPSNDADFSGRWRRIKGHFSSALIDAGIELKRRPNGDLALWQKRFWEHTIRDEGDFARHVDYIHFNPIKHGLVPRVRDWPHSSFHRYVREGLLPDDWAGSSAKAQGTSERGRDDPNLVPSDEAICSVTMRSVPDVASLIRATARCV
jgi:putative transposase